MTRRQWLIVLAACAAALVVMVEAVHLVTTYRDLTAGRRGLLAAERALTDVQTLSLSADGLDSLHADLALAQTRLRRVRATLNGDPLLWLFARTPLVGGQVTAAQALASMGAALATAGVDAVAGLQAAQNARAAAGGALSEQLVPVLQAVAPHAGGAKQAIADAERHRRQIRGALLPPLRSAVAEFDTRIRAVDQLASGYDQASVLAPTLLGYDAPKSYLVLAHDNSEMLGAGGFVLVYGTLTFDRGRLTQIFFDNITNLHPDWPPPDPEHYIQPPAPLAEYLLHGWPMGFGEASWWLDFPTEARAAIDLYHVNSGRQTAFDGVIGVNFFTLQALLRIVGPVTVDKYGVTVDAGNVVENTLITTNPVAPRPGEDPYAFTGDVAQEIIVRLMRLDQAHWPALFETLGGLVRERNLALFAGDATTEQAIANAGADEALRPGDGDFLMVADSSVGTTKLNYVVRSSLQLDVSLDERGSATDSVTLSYSNPFTEATAGKPERLKEIFAGPKPFYFDYLRLYTPPGSELTLASLDGQRFDQADDPVTESGATVFGRFLNLPLDTARTVRFGYRVPGATTSSGKTMTYRLHLRKQPGSQTVPVSIMVHAPHGYRVTGARLDGRTVTSQDGQFTTDLGQDRELVVALRKAA